MMTLATLLAAIPPGSLPSTGNGYADLFLALLALLVGGSGGGAIVGWRKDRRAERTDDASLTETLRRMAREAIEEQEDRHAEQREEWRHERATLLRRVNAQDRRILQLEGAMREAGIEVPAPLRVVGEG